MSTQYPGGFITKSPVAPTTSAASGIWTVDQALQYVKAGTWPTPPLFIEDLFSTYLFTGNALASQTITNNIDVSGKGGLVWIKSRNTTGTDGNYWQDTARGATSSLVSNSTAAATSGVLSSFTSSGFVQTAGWGTADFLASWTFAKQPKFFDIVTYTGTGAAGNVSHSLGTTPGFLIIKRISSVGNWVTFARDGTSSSKYTYSYFNTSAGLNLPAVASAINIPAENSGYITSTTFDPNSLSGSGAVGNADNINDSGVSYVAYLFANDAGGFPANGGGSTNGISCGSFTTDGSGNATTTLGYEPQFVMRKRTDASEGWQILDNMRGWFVSTNDDNMLQANTSGAEITGGNYGTITSTGFTSVGSFSARYIYIAIRRGPMKTPTDATTVFSPQYNASGATGTAITTNFPVDMQMQAYTGGDGYNSSTHDRLRGVSTTATQLTNQLVTSSTAAEAAPNSTMTNYWNSTGFLKPQYYNGVAYISWNFRRAPGFFDEVCYTGNGNTSTGQQVTHNLGVTPDLIICKRRNAVSSWGVWYSQTAGYTGFAVNLNAGPNYSGYTGVHTSTYFNSYYVVAGTTFGDMNTNTGTYAAYLFATCPGVSKVGSYTGTAALQTINCGFGAGARFVLIKRTDAAGDWYVWDSARGISSSTDPYILLNSTVAQTTGTDYVDTDTTGFKLNAAGSTTVNISAATYLFLAIA